MAPFALLLATRLDWGFANPNKTATLIATLMIAVWVLPALHRLLFWPALLLCTGLGVCLMQTASRGGIVAVALGLGIVLARLPLSWPRARMFGAMAAFWVVLGIAVWLPTAARFGKAIGGQDLSILSRLELWRAAPQMMVDAPAGWGLGRSADVFHQWYQPVSENQLFTSLINSHLTWMVEIGWGGRFLYVFGWLVVLTLCWLRRADVQKHPALAIPFGLWTAFGVTAWFNSVAESPWLWLAPVAGLASAVWWRWQTRQWPDARQWLTLACCACAVLGACWLSGTAFAKEPRLRLSGARVVLGDSQEPAVWLLVNRQTLGGSYGQTLRRYVLSNLAQKNGHDASIGLVDSLEDLPVEVVKSRTLAICGTPDDRQLGLLKHLLPACPKLVLLNPTFFPQALGVGGFSADRIEIVAGEFSQVPASAWGEIVKSPLITVQANGDYLARWPELLFKPHSSTVP